ncbi:PREDICTED: probable BOI-related E3 ubiquitin-protein ligase 2 [Camelina sativa]|uniref:Probable BOI-related E3 ubiquitin-protein ligase 2 n=1 Tax=Camelina sativa TaxID=90675 RepID=A0ABM0TQL7_CAMSA|nr:PREDICTED: probable BOI-related E3 ubiquitin-protein ligase 2 [Camelina sativa]
MAVDAHNLFLSPPQLFSNREFMMNNNTTMEPTSGGFCNNNQTIYGVVSPFPVTDDTTTPPHLHMYGCGGGADTTIPTTADYYAVDGTTTSTTNLDCDFFPLPSRKRSRDTSSTRSNYYHHHHHLLLLQNQRSSTSSCVNTATSTTPFSFLGQDIDISSHMNQQQHEIDRFVSLHMERVKYEIEEKRKRQARMIMEAIEQGLAKRLRVKEEERERIVKVNHALEERVKSLSIENQIWRDLAQTNEATANHLRTNLDQVLAQVNDLRCAGGSDADNNNNNNEEDDAESCCGSTTKAAKTEEEGRRKLLCRNCGEEESCVLLLPCRHLCLCGVCGSSVHTCPICTSPKNASVHVNMSSS